MPIYVATVELLGPALQPEQAPLIAETVALSNATIVDAYHQET